ncbi:hypothetical protein GCM10020331_090940 [Ectobacillus funiculus]
MDVLAVFATVFGVATSLGLGAKQIAGGLSYILPNVSNTLSTQLVIILVVTVLYMLSAQTGLNKGIKYLSNANVLLALLLLAGLLFVGPTNFFLMNYFTSTIGSYIQKSADDELQLKSAQRQRQRVDSRLDNFLLGLVDRLVSVCWDLHRPYFARPHHP